MKAIIILVAILAVAVAGIYYFGGYRSFDPSQQGQTARAAIKPGMPWNTVVSIAGNPREYRHFIKESAKGGRKGLESVKPGPQVRFDPAAIKQRLADNSVPDGFIFIYHFSNTVAFQVVFDNLGTVTSVDDAMTIGDLLKSK